MDDPPRRPPADLVAEVSTRRYTGETGEQRGLEGGPSSVNEQTKPNRGPTSSTTTTPTKGRGYQKTIVSYSDRFIPSRCVRVAGICCRRQIHRQIRSGLERRGPRQTRAGSLWVVSATLSVSVCLSVCLARSLARSLGIVRRLAGLGRRGSIRRCWSGRRWRRTCRSRRRTRIVIRRRCMG